LVTIQHTTCCIATFQIAVIQYIRSLATRKGKSKNRKMFPDCRRKPAWILCAQKSSDDTA